MVYQPFLGYLMLKSIFFFLQAIILFEVYNNDNWYPWNIPERPGKKTKGTGDQRIKTIQTIALLKSTRILRKILENLKRLVVTLISGKKPPVKTDMENLHWMKIIICKQLLFEVTILKLNNLQTVSNILNMSNFPLDQVRVHLGVIAKKNDFILLRTRA